MPASVRCLIEVRVSVASGTAFVVEVDAAQPVGDAPGEQGTQGLGDGVSKTLDHTTLFGRFDDQQRGPRTQQGSEILIDAH